MNCLPTIKQKKSKKIHIKLNRDFCQKLQLEFFFKGIE